MCRAVSLALLLASFLTPFLEAQRTGTGFRGFAKVNGQSGHVRQGAFSNGQFAGNLHHRERLGFLLSPSFLRYDKPYWWTDHEPEPVPAEPVQGVLYPPPNRARPPADPQLIETPGAPSKGGEKPPMPAVFVLIN